MLCGYDYQWVRSRGSYIPENAFIAGRSEVRYGPLYVARAKFDGYLINGKVHSLYGTCYLPYQGKEIEVGEYEILVRPSVAVRGEFCEDDWLWSMLGLTFHMTVFEENLMCNA